MALSAQDVKGIATLARLSIDDADIADYATRLSSIIDFAGQLNDAAVDDIQPMAHPLDQVQRLRTDTAVHPNQRELYQQNAPAVEAGLYTVPRVIE